MEEKVVERRGFLRNAVQRSKIDSFSALQNRGKQKL